MMASDPELPLPLFLEYSSSFCSSLKNDLDQFIDEIGGSFLSVNRTAKIAPRQRRKNRQLDAPGSCTLDLKEFTTSKQNVLHKFQTRFETMEEKWSNDIAELKDWFLKKIETCLSKVKLEIKVSAEDLNLSQPVHEIELCEDSPDSGSEVDTMSDDQLPDSALASSHHTNGHPQDVDPSYTSGFSVDVGNIVFQGDMSSLDVVRPPVNSKKMGKRVAGTAQVKKSARATRLNKKEIASIPGSGVDEPPVRSRRSNWQGTDMSSALDPPDNIGTNNFQESVDSLHTASPPPPAISKKMSRKGTGRVQMKKGAKPTQLSREDIATDFSIPDSDIEEPAVRRNISDTATSCALIPPGVTGTHDFLENVDSLHTASPPPPVKRGRKGTGRAQIKKGARATQLSSEQIATDSIMLGSGAEEPAVRSSVSDTDMPYALIPPGVTGTHDSQEDVDFLLTASPPPVKRGRKGTGRAQVKKGARATQLRREQIAPDSIILGSGIEVPAVRSSVSDIDMPYALIPPGVVGIGDIQKNADMHHRASPPLPENTNKRGKKVTGGRGQMKKGAKSTQQTKEESSTIPIYDIDKPAVRSKVSHIDVPCTSILPNIVTSVFQGETGSLHTASHPPANTKKMGKRGTGRAQVRNGIAMDTDRVTVPNLVVEKPALRSKVSDWQGSEALCGLGPHGDVDNSVFQENMGSCLEASPPPANTKRTGRKGAGRAQMKKGAKAIQLSNSEITSAVNIPSTDELVLRGKVSDWQGLLTAVENAPCKPGLFEVKVWRAKKAAYIGHTDNLQQSISKYREGKPSGEKHLDQFIQRNKDEISVRYEAHPSLQLAKLEQKKRLKEFMEKHKNLPSYNYGL